MNLPQTAQNFIDMQRTPNTRRAYAQDLRRWFGFLAEHGQEVTTEKVITFRDHLTTTLHSNSAERVFRTVRGYYRWLATFQPSVPELAAFAQVKGPKRVEDQTPKVPDDEDVDRLVLAAWDNPGRSLIISLLLNGLRASEVAGLRKQDIETHEGVVVMRVLGKGNKERLVPMTIEAQRALVRWSESCRPEQKASPWLVSDYDGSKLTYRQVEHAVYVTARYAGVEGMYPHALRHHYATRLIRSGATVFHVQKLLGHARPDTTQVYVGLDLRDLVEAAAKDPRNQQGRAEVRAVS